MTKRLAAHHSHAAGRASAIRVRDTFGSADERLSNCFTLQARRWDATAASVARRAAGMSGHTAPSAAGKLLRTVPLLAA